MNGWTALRSARIVGVFAMIVALLGAPLARTPIARADHLAEPTRVTVPGNFNEEIGCTSGDWQPSCNGEPGTIPNTPTPLQANDLEPQGNGVWARTIEIPATNAPYEYKVALNGAWADSFAGRPEVNTNTGLAINATTQVRFYYDHKTHFVADNFNQTIYTIPGDFNSELGCEGDWQPQCLRTLMSDVDGDGIYTFSTSAIPPGDYQFKVATNEDWGNPNYGVDGGDANVPFSVTQANVTVNFSFNSTTNVPTVVVGNPPPPEDAALLRAPVSDPVNQSEIFYFVMPDRFANGDPLNDTAGLTGDVFTHGFLPTDKGYYHGGDLAGLIEQLPYIDALGVTAIWMTPMFKNRPVQCANPQQPTLASCSAGYHGYWPVDFTQIDPHFGTNDEMKQFIAAANARGMRVFFDIITNHTADVIDYEGRNYDYISRADAPYRDANGDPFNDRDFIFADNFPPMNAASFPKTPIFNSPADATVKVPAWLNDITMYHNRGNARFDGGESDLYGDFLGLDGLFTERPEVVRGMIDIHKFWISEFGIDGFRIDTAKHVNMEFWQQFIPELETYAAENGKPNFFMFGEVFEGNPAVLSRFTREGNFPAVLDFDFNYSVGDFATGDRGPDRLSGLFRGDDYYTTATNNAYNLPTFLGNHDVGRIGTRMQQPFPNDPTDSQRLARMLLGYGLMFTARGVPIIYYGDEQGFTGDGNDKDARQNMFPSQVDSYNDDNLIGTNATTADDNFNQSHPLFIALQELATLRKTHPTLQTGAQIERIAESGSSGVYAFSRIDRTTQIEYVVALNNANAARTVTVPTFASVGTSFDGIYNSAATLVANGDGALSVEVPALGMVVFRQNPSLGLNVNVNNTAPIGPAISISSPIEGATVEPGLLEVAATVNGNLFAEVSFAVSVDGGAYEHIGTDTNAPYRVFYDTRTAPAGANLSFKAVVTDLLGEPGNFNSATVNLGLAIPAPCVVKPEYAVVHYYREDGNYDDWGLHLWGDAIAPEEVTTWDAPKPFMGETDYGVFAFIRLQDSTKPVNFIVHQPNGDTVPDTRDPGGNRSFIPSAQPQIFLKGGDETIYASQAAAQGYVTIHYNRPDDDYSNVLIYAFGDGLSAGELTDHPMSEFPGTRTIDGTDDFGAFVRIGIGDATKQIGVIVLKDGAKETEPDRLLIPAERPTLWINNGDTTNYRSRSAAEGVVTLRYHRPEGDYGDFTSTDFNDFWGLHLWSGTDPSIFPSGADNIGWQTPFKPNLPQDKFGIGFRVPLAENTPTWTYILHRGDTKDQAADQVLDLATIGNEIWIVQEMPGTYPYLLPVEAGCVVLPVDQTAQQKAYWLEERTIAWEVAVSVENDYTLFHAPEGGMTLTEEGVQGGTAIQLSISGAGLSAATRAKFPHLANLPAFSLPEGTDVKAILTGQFWVAARNSSGDLIEVTGLQIPGVLDDLYAEAASTATFGPDFSVVPPAAPAIGLRLWAPTAKNVNVLLFNTIASQPTRIAMTRDDASGIWSTSLDISNEGKFYLFEVQVFVPSTGRIETNRVTDPYSVSLAMNSVRSQLVDLSRTDLKPTGWDGLIKPALDAFEDIVLYELHVRDFSITDPTVPEAQRGTFKAFTQQNSNGMRHLRTLAADGLTHVHLLPVFDIATINENTAERTEILGRFDELRAMAPDGLQQQEITSAINTLDGFNWGYDPFHFNVPEGSYSTNPQGTTRIVEFREMVNSLNNNGLRVVVDVVYNHTNASGQSQRSVFDRIVPGYYHRLNSVGVVERSTCCDNTATEHAMMEKFMVDSVVLWAREYKVDAFRFDLMGHHMKSNMIAVREALDALTLEEDGVDGSKIFIYGEGWNLGEVENNTRGVNATQLNMPGTGIATFSDRLRDAVRGGGPFDEGEGMKRQGFATGLFTAPNDLNQGSADDKKRDLLRATDLIRVGMAGNLANFPLVNSAGDEVVGSQVPYGGGAPGGYTLDPQEVITYIEAHDNETYFDAIQLKAPATATITDRVRMHNLGISIVMLSQGVPFFHAGQDFLRSKSGDRDSYNSGDWFNRVDWTMNEHNWGSGLPPAEKNTQNWGVLGPVLANPALRPARTNMLDAHEHFREMLRVRKSTPLFRLRTAEEVIAQVRFLNTGAEQVPGLIVMHIVDSATNPIEPRGSQVVVLVNASPDPITFTVAELAGTNLALNREQINSRDAMIAEASYDAETGTFTVPGRTTVVYDDFGLRLSLPIIAR
jgi:pullulanase-type alpha-1,6-glucosidase